MLIIHCFRDVPIARYIQDDQQDRLDELPEDMRLPAESQHATYERAARSVTERDRKCPLWMRYQPGLGPIDHLAGAAANDMERDRRTFQLQLERDRQSFEERIEQQRRRSVEAADAIRAEQDRKTRRAERWLTGAALFLAAVQILSAGPDSFLAAMLRALTGWPPAGP